MTEAKGFAYYKAVRKNSEIDEYRKNEIEREHCYPAGDDLLNVPGENENSVEEQLSEESPDNWLMFLENTQLHSALLQLSADDRKFLFQYAVLGHTQRELAQLYGIRQQSVHNRYQKILRNIRKFLKMPVKK